MKKGLAVALPILAVILYVSVSRIPAGSVGILERGGAIEVWNPGMHLHRPLQRPAAIYALELPAVQGEAKVALADGASYAIGFEISGRLDPARAEAFHRSASRDGAGAIEKSAGEAALARAGAAKGSVDLASGKLEAEASRQAGLLLAPAGLTDVALKLRPLAPAEGLRLAQALAPARLAGLVRPQAAKSLEAAGAGWEAHTTMGLVLESEKDVHGAEKEYLDALTLSPSALPPMAQLVTIYSAVGENGKLDRLLEAALKAQPGSLQHLVWFAMSLTAQGRTAEAQGMMEKAIALDPGNVALLNDLGGIQVKAGRLTDATATFRKALEAKPGDRQSLYNLGVALSAGGRDREALPHLLAAEKAGSPGPALLRSIAHALRATGDARRAAEYDRRAAAPTAPPAPPSSP